MNDVKLRKVLVSDLADHQVLGDHTDGLAACFQDGVGNRTHQTDVSATIDQADISLSQLRTQPLGTRAILGTAPRTGATKNADPFHGVILSRAGVEMGLSSELDRYVRASGNVGSGDRGLLARYSAADGLEFQA